MEKTFWRVHDRIDVRDVLAHDWKKEALGEGRYVRRV